MARGTLHMGLIPPTHPGAGGSTFDTTHPLTQKELAQQRLLKPGSPFV